MLSGIGIMAGCYILTRMVSVLTTKGPAEESSTVKTFAWITLGITTLVIIDLMLRGQSGQEF